MLRLIVILALVAQSVATQERPQPEDNPLVNDPYWQFQVGMEAYAQTKRTLASQQTPSLAMAAHFRLGSKPDALRAARGLLTADAVELTEGPRLLLEHSYDFNDDATSLHADLIGFVADTRRRVAAVPPKEGADAALQLLWLEYAVNRGDEGAHKQRIAEFLATYDGTSAATAYTIGQVESVNARDTEGNVRRFRELARQHDGTVNGAMALYLLAFRQGAQLSNVDPTALLEVFEVVKELESDRFPPCRWVNEAPRLVSGFYFGGKTKIPTASFLALYAGYLDFSRAHPNRPTRNATEDTVRWVIRSGVSSLGATPEARLATVERFLGDLGKGGFGVNNVRFLRAQFYLGLTDPRMLDSSEPSLIDPKEAETRARYSLNVMIESAAPAAVARAWATLAGHDLYDGRYPEARGYFTQLANSPASEWTWVAALRAAEAHEALGDVAGAATEYESIATKFASNSTAVALARVAAGEAYESLTRYDAAAANFKAALEAWKGMPEVTRIRGLHSERAKPSPADERFRNLTRASLVARTDRLTASAGPDGALLHEGRRALEIEKPQDAVKPLRQLLAEYPRSSKAAEARVLLRRTRFEAALSLKGLDATRELDDLIRGPYDPIVSLSKLAKAATLRRRGQHTYELAKENGAWVAKRMVSMWIT